MAVLAGGSPSLVTYKFSISTTRSPRSVKLVSASGAAAAQTMYELLSVPNTAGPQEIRAAFRRLALRWHPDTCGSGGGEERRRHAERFMAVREAYEVLSDPARRRAYDLDIAGGRLTVSFRDRRARRRGGVAATTASGSNWETQLDGLRRRSAAAEAGGEETWGGRVRRIRRADTVS